MLHRSTIRTRHNFSASAASASRGWRPYLLAVSLILSVGRVSAQPASSPLLVASDGAAPVAPDSLLLDGVLAGEDATFSVALPSGGVVTLVPERYWALADGDAVTGKIDGETFGDFTLVRSGGRVAGAIRSTRYGAYELRPVDEQHIVVQNVAEIVKTCGPPMRIEKSGAAPKVAPLALSATRSSPGCDDGSVIDMLVVYTSAARVAAGGTANIQTLINTAIVDANAAFARSNVTISLNLVHSEEIVYTETGNSDIDGARLLDPDDGFLDDAHTLREAYRADLVALWVQNFDFGGRVFGPVEPSGYAGFQIMRQDNATILTMGHETGHNLGCAHDRENSAPDAYFEYAYGYRAPAAAFRTIMAYPPGTPISYFANPNVNYMGQPTGIPDGQPLPCDTAHAMNQTRLIVANYRNAAVGGLPARLYVNASAAPGGNGQSWATAYRDLQDALCAARRSSGAVSEVWVALGTYKPDMGSNLRQMSFRLVDGLAIYGGFAGGETLLSQRDPETHPTILSGDIGVGGSTSDNSQHVVVAEDVDGTARLDGFTIEAGNAFVQDLYFKYNGGGVRIRNASPMIANCVIQNNLGAYGAGVSLNTDSNPTFDSVTFDGNIATVAGGGAYLNGAGGTFEDCHFNDNSSPTGGAVYAYNSHPLFTGGQFAENQATDGGAIYLDGGTPTALNVMFMGNISTGSGGAIANYGAGDSQFTDCHFELNISAYGGAAHNRGNLSFLRCEFVFNAVSANGGAIDAAFSGTTEIDSCLLDSNLASWAGGANIYQANVVIRGATFSANTSDTGGGGLILGDGATFTIDDTDFSANEAGFGGGVYAYNVGAGRIATCNFEGNTAADGGATYLYNAQPRYFDCRFIGNIAQATGGAAVDYLGATGFTRCEFSGNIATYGGAGAAWGGAASQFVNCGFFGNMADWSGGAFQNDGGAASFTGCLMSGNRAIGSHGGALANGADSSATLSNCTLAYNNAGWVGGGIATDPPHVLLRNSILWGNTHSFAADETAQVYHFDATHSDFQWTTVQGWTGAWGGVGNTGANPLFVDPDGGDGVFGTTDDDLSLSASSPLIDSGANALVPSDVLDLDADANIAEPLPMDYFGGARFVDAPIADSGLGVAPIVDRGYAEFAAPTCPGDLDGDNQVSITDLAIVLSHFGQTGNATAADGDFDGDHDVDIQDLAYMLSRFGSTCN